MIAGCTYLHRKEHVEIIDMTIFHNYYTILFICTYKFGLNLTFFKSLSHINLFTNILLLLYLFNELKKDSPFHYLDNGHIYQLRSDDRK